MEVELPIEMWRLIAYQVSDGIFLGAPGEPSSLVSLFDEDELFLLHLPPNEDTFGYENHDAAADHTLNRVLPCLFDLHRLARVCRRAQAAVDWKAVALCIDAFCRKRLLRSGPPYLHDRTYVGNADADDFFSPAYWRLLIVCYAMQLVYGIYHRHLEWRVGKPLPEFETMLAKERQKGYAQWKDSMRIDWTKRTRRK
jgi:hypothetical protein